MSVRAAGLHPPIGVPVIIIDDITDDFSDKPFADFVIITAGKVAQKELGSWRHRGVYPIELADVNVGYYMVHFAFFESLITAILALHQANSLSGYYKTWQQLTGYEGKDLCRRIDLVEEMRSQNFNEEVQSVDGVQHLRKVRNQLVHTLYPLTIKYKSIIYARRDDDGSLRKVLSKDLTAELYNVLKLYKLVQDDKLAVWLPD